MAEWLKAHDSKSCGRGDRLGGSNPLASATKNDPAGLFLWLQRRIPRGGLLPPFFLAFVVEWRYEDFRWSYFKARFDGC